MKKIFFVLIWIWLDFSLIILSFFLLYKTSNFDSGKIDIENNLSIQASDIIPNQKKTYPSIVPQQDIRYIALKLFFEQIRSPLIDHIDDIINNADLNGIDYALVPAISMQESNGCKKLPADSYNCWGFGIYGNKITKFNSYEEAIARVSKTIKEAYIKKGLTNSTLIEDRWAPPSKGIWSYSVNFYISHIHGLEKNNPAS